MKKYEFADIQDIILIPVITYLLSGLLIIQLCGLPVSSTYYAVWGVMAGVVLGIWKCFSSKAVTVGICVYGAAIFIWLVFFIQSGGIQHALLICISFVSLIILQKLMQKRIIKVLAGFIIMVLLIGAAVWGEKFSKLIVAMAIILFLNAVSELIACFYSGNVKSLIVIYVVVAIFTLLMPVSEEPYGWDFVFKIIESIEKNLIGYSDSEADLSSQLADQKIEQLVIKGDYTKRQMYLRGSIENEYVGNTWKNNIQDENIDYRTDTLMTLYAIFAETEDIDELSRFMDIKNQEVTFKQIRTQSVFYPLKVLEVSAKGVKNNSGVLGLETANGSGYSYSYSFVDIDYSNATVVKILESSKNIEYKEEIYNRIYTNLQELYGIELEPISFDEFCEMAERCRAQAEKQYTNVGDKVSERVVELANETAANCENDYETCKKLEKYMYQYRYNKEIEAPDNADMLEWFLFEGKEGYCAHYATALAVMLRCRDVPTRVSEGFLVGYSRQLDRNEYSILSDTAHMWVEAYIDGFGWIRLEPTTANSVSANAAWYINAAEQEPVEEEIFDIQEEPEAEGEALKAQQTNAWVLMIGLLIGCVVIVSVIVAAVFIKQKIAVRRSKNPDIVCNHMLALLGKRYFAKLPSETLAEYFDRLKASEDVADNIKNELSEIQTAMENYWYGNHEVAEAAVFRMKKLEL